MRALFAFAFAVLFLRGQFSGEPRDLHWPFGNGIEAFPLRATYGQFEGEPGSADLHFGLDIYSDDPGEIVHALEDGVVVTSHEDGYYSGLVVASDAVPGRAFLYLHIEKKSRQFNPGDHVAKNDILGTVVTDDPHTGVPHLHLSRLGETNHPWNGLDRYSVCNPLTLLDLDLLGDTVAPSVEKIAGGEQVAIRANENPYLFKTPEYPPLKQLPASPLDAILDLYDRDGMDTLHRLAPYEMELTVKAEGGSAWKYHLLFDGSLAQWDNVEGAFYNLDDAHPSIGITKTLKYHYFYVLTNGDSVASTTSAWPASPGKYVLSGWVKDVAKNQSDFRADVEVK